MYGISKTSLVIISLLVLSPLSILLCYWGVWSMKHDVYVIHRWPWFRVSLTTTLITWLVGLLAGRTWLAREFAGHDPGSGSSSTGLAVFTSYFWGGFVLLFWPGLDHLGTGSDGPCILLGFLYGVLHGVGAHLIEKDVIDQECGDWITGLQSLRSRDFRRVWKELKIRAEPEVAAYLDILEAGKVSYDRELRLIEWMDEATLRTTPNWDECKALCNPDVFVERWRKWDSEWKQKNG